jgi:short-subunit dehydrogenase
MALQEDTDMKKTPFFQNTVIVTGASLGIGMHLSLQLAEKGAWLVLAARNKDELDKVASQCRDRGGRAIAVATDVTDSTQCKALIERSVEEYGRIDTLINNAGIGMRAKFDELPDLSVMETVMRVNFWGSVYCTHYALKHLKATRGRIVGILSGGGGLFAAPGAVGYGASKSALVGFYKTVRVELVKSGISVTLYYPDWVATGISARAPGADGDPYGKIISHEQGAMSPEVCAKHILKTVAGRQREGMPPRLKLGSILNPILPGLVDKIVLKAFAEAD